MKNLKLEKLWGEWEFQVVESRHKRKAFLKTIFFLIVYELYENILWMKPEDLLKIQKGLMFLKKKIIGKRYYTNPIFKKTNNGSLSTIINKITNRHDHQLLTLSNVTWDQNETLYDNIFFIENSNKIDLTSIITNELNLNVNKVDNNLNLLIKNNNLTLKDKNKILNKKFLINKPIDLKKGDNVEIIGIQNLTTSAKNSTSIVKSNVLLNYPVNKGINLYDDNMLLFLLENSEEYRRVLWFIIYLYEPDLINQYNLSLYSNRLNFVAERNMVDVLYNEPIINIKFKRLIDSKEFNLNKNTIFGYLYEELKNR